jgi:hypothetical protein
MPGALRRVVFADDLDALVVQIAERGLTGAERETYSNGVEEAAVRDCDGNEIGVVGAPLPSAAAPRLIDHAIFYRP